MTIRPDPKNDNAWRQPGEVGKANNTSRNHISNRISRLIWVSDYRLAGFCMWLRAVLSGGVRHA